MTCLGSRGWLEVVKPAFDAQIDLIKESLIAEDDLSMEEIQFLRGQVVGLRYIEESLLPICQHEAENPQDS